MLYVWRTAVQAVFLYINWEGNLDLCKWVCFLKEFKGNLWETHFPAWETASYSWHTTVPLQHLLKLLDKPKAKPSPAGVVLWIVGTWHRVQGCGPIFPSRCQSCQLDHTCSNKLFFFFAFTQSPFLNSWSWRAAGNSAVWQGSME